MTTTEQPSSISPLQRALVELEQRIYEAKGFLRAESADATADELDRALDGVKALILKLNRMPPVSPEIAERVAGVLDETEIDLAVIAARRAAEAYPSYDRNLTVADHMRMAKVVLMHRPRLSFEQPDAVEQERACARPPAEVVYEAPSKPLVELEPETGEENRQSALNAAVDEMRRAVLAIRTEVHEDIANEVQKRFETVLVRAQQRHPTAELVALRYFHDNVTERLRSIRRLDSSTKRALGLARLEDDVLTNGGQALMQPPAPPTVTRREDGAYTVGPTPGGKTVDERLAELTAPDWTAHNGRSNSSPLFIELIKRVAEIIRESAHSIVAGQLDSVARSVMSSLAHEHNLIPRTLTRSGPLWLWRAWTDDNRLADSGWCAGASKEAAERQAWQIAGGPLHGLIKRIEITTIPEKA